MNPTDLRVVKTRESIRDSLFACLRERPYDEVTVSQVVAGARVNRSTFYRNYRDKRDLLESVVRGLLDRLREAVDPELLEEARRGRDALARDLEPVARLFDEERGRLATLWSADLPLDLHDRMVATVIERLAAAGGTPMADDPRYGMFLWIVAATVVTQMRWWTANDVSLSPREMSDLVARTLLEGVVAVLEG